MAGLGGPDLAVDIAELLVRDVDLLITGEVDESNDAERLHDEWCRLPGHIQELPAAMDRWLAERYGDGLAGRERELLLSGVYFGMMAVQRWCELDDIRRSTDERPSAS